MVHSLIVSYYANALKKVITYNINAKSITAPTTKLETIIPSRQTQFEGNTIFARCFSNREPKWEKIGDKTNTYSTKTGGVLFIPHATVESNGDYKCIGVNSSNVKFNAIFQVRVGRRFILLLDI